MSNYYYIVAGLPDIAATDAKPSLTPDDVREQILDQVTRDDRRLLEGYLLHHDNANLLGLLSGKADRWHAGGLYSREQLEEGIAAVREQGADAAWPTLPAYMKTYLVGALREDGGDWLTDSIGEDKAEALGHTYSESRLSALYYDEMLAKTSGAVKAWFEFSLNVGNLLTASNCRRLDMNPKEYVIGTGDVADRLRTSTARDWQLTGELDYLDDVMAIAAETDVLKKERALDQLRWQWIDDAVIFKSFGVERLLAYLVQLDIVGRWATLQAERGESKLRDIVEGYKKRVVQ